MTLLENNKDIDGLINYLNSKVILLKNKYPNSESLNITEKFYNEIVIPWMENYKLLNNEVDDEYDQSIKNDILDLINEINKVIE